MKNRAQKKGRMLRGSATQVYPSKKEKYLRWRSVFS
jgi:hypothetical protein